MSRICGGCAARAAARGVETRYVWTSDDGMNIVVYDSLLKAKAKVSRKGGSFVPRDLPKDQPTG